jgi:hypothetical protein
MEKTWLIKGILFLLILLNSGNYLAFGETRLAGQCANSCNDLIHDVLIPEICEDAKKLAPIPKVGHYCMIAMEAGYRDACQAMCTQTKPEYNIATACRRAAMELPRPTVRQWCEHGYSEAFAKTQKDLAPLFQAELLAKVTPSPRNVKVKTSTSGEIKKSEQGSLSVQHQGKTAQIRLLAGQSLEDAVVAFCQYEATDMTECIREVLPQALETMSQSGEL